MVAATGLTNSKDAQEKMLNMWVNDLRIANDTRPIAKLALKVVQNRAPSTLKFQ